MEEEIKVMIKFSQDTPYGRFNGVLYFTEDEYKTIDKATIMKMEEVEYEKWIQQTAPSLTELRHRESGLISQIDTRKFEIANLEVILEETRRIIAIVEAGG